MKSIKESLDAEKEQKVKLEKVRCVCNHKQSSIITHLKFVVVAHTLIIKSVRHFSP